MYRGVEVVFGALAVNAEYRQASPRREEWGQVAAEAARGCAGSDSYRKLPRIVQSYDPIPI